MNTTHILGRPLHPTRQLQARRLAAALLLAAGSAMAAPVANAQHTPNAPSAADHKAGEAPAQAYHGQHRAKFESTAPVITPAQTAAAQAEGALEGPRVTSPAARKPASASK